MHSPDRRVSLVLHEDVFNEILKLSQKENRSLNFTIATLLQKALKEKNRKRAKKENSIQHHASN
jgi:hypothetical protein